MSRILIDARNINTTTGRYAERLIHYLEKLDKTNDYLIVVFEKDKDYYKPRNRNFRIITNDTPWYSFAEQLGFKRFIEEQNPDLVHFTMPHRPVALNIPAVTTIHDLTLLKTYNSDKNWFVFRAKQFVGRFVFKSIAKTSAAVICPTNYVKGEYAKFAGIDPAKITVTYEGSDIDESLTSPYEPLRDRKFIMYVGQQSGYKNIRKLIEAHQKLLDTHPHLALALVGKISKNGNDPITRNKEWAREQGYMNVVFTDFISDGQLAWCMQNCVAYVFPSLTEGFGLPGLEAMAMGAPVVSSNATCLPEVYGDAAEYFNPMDVDDMVRAIDLVICDQSRRERLIKLGYAQHKKYSWKRMAEQTLKVYEKALKDTST